MLPTLLIFALAGIGPAVAPHRAEYPHVRTADRRITGLIDDAMRRSITFSRLYQALQQGDVILFIETSRELRPALAGRLVFVSATPLVRYLRAEITADLPRADMVAIIAHEMQHALEVAGAPLVRDERTMAVLYHHIGLTKTGAVLETEQAQAVARRVRREVLA